MCYEYYRIAYIVKIIQDKILQVIYEHTVGILHPMYV
jgi:hypothetical protein